MRIPLFLMRSVFLPIFILFSSSIFAEEPKAIRPQWEFAGWYGGGCYPDIQFDPMHKNRVYLTSDVAGIWRSDDRGESWRFINNGIEDFTVAFIVPAPSNSDVLYAGTKSGLFRSIDAGANWERCDRYRNKIAFKRPENYKSAVISRSNAAKLVIGTADGDVLYSEDSGDHWKPLGYIERSFFKGSAITAMAWSSDENFLYAASSKGLAMYSFEKKRWKFFADGPKNISDLVISKNDPNAFYVAGARSLWISDDSGKSWRQTSPISRGLTYRIALLSPDSSNKIPIMTVAWNDGWRGGVLFSDDEGKSWRRGEQKMFPDNLSDPTRLWAGTEFRINALKADPFNDQTLFFTEWWGIWRSDDGGSSWHEKIKGAPNTVAEDILAQRDGTLYVATMDNGLLKSLDGGKSFTPIYPVGAYDNRVNGHVWRVCNADASNSKLIATASPWFDKLNQVVLIDAIDEHFEIVRHGLPGKRPAVNTMWEAGYPRALAVDPKDPKRVYLGIDGDDGGGLFISDDGGKSWEYSKGQPACKRVFNALAVDPSDTNRIYWGAYSENGNAGGIYLSEDRGMTWKQVFDQVNKVFNLAIAKDGTVYVAGDEKGPVLYVSQDHGKTWKLLNRFGDEGAVTGICLNGKDEKKIAIGTAKWNAKKNAHLVYISEDSGVHWEDYTSDLPFSSGINTITYSSKDGYLYVAESGSSIYKVKWP